ncbi:substrate-binding domain-containing protein [Acuticoccus mangrovi]|uniref:4,5-dihydroxyphthalate decarboxylase n=1 Tax=Acuticoccus mangrovi TaxID=2796142 RepID=A0A934IKS6_9HYPH|nr:hypothetical protein [Acuticoccus mangrovi]MBJ3776791.1 hypothetical protein [Acuticoccus mangrovi]
MRTQELSVGCIGFDRVRAMADGRVGIPGYHIAMPRMNSLEIFDASLVRGKLSVAEISPGFLASYLESGKRDYAGLPIPIARSFRHGSIYVREGGRIAKPTDLRGATIGVPDLMGTTYIWQKGMLQDEFSIDLSEVTWMIGKVDEGLSGWSQPKAGHMPGASVVVANGTDTLSELLVRGEIDAILSIKRPERFRKKTGIVRLMPDFHEREKDFYARTGILPIMHMMTIRCADVARDPDLPGKVVSAFTAAKNIALEELRETMYYFSSLPFLPHAVEEAEAVFGDDFWPYGIEKNRRSMETFFRYCQEQGLTEKRLQETDFFPHFV